MKIVISSLLLLVSTFAGAKETSIEVEMPKDAKHVYFSVKDFTVNACSQYTFEAVSDRESTSPNTFVLESVNKGNTCISTAEKSITLWTSAKIVRTLSGKETMTVVFDSEQVDKLKIEFN